MQDRLGSGPYRFKFIEVQREMANSTWQARAIQSGVVAAALCALLTMTGCGAMNMTESGSSGGGQAIEGPALHGTVHGGNNPVSGATIQLYSVGASGYGQGALPLLNTTVTTSSTGGFSFTTANWTCVPGTYIYITSTGGNPGLTATSGTPSNPSAAFMAALGNCSNITSNTNILLNEITTVAAVFALQQFISITPNVSLYAQPGTASGVTPAMSPAFEIGSSPGNVQGLKNAFEVAAVLANTSTGVTPGALPAPVAPATTSNRTLTVETWHLNTIADILASCINTDTTTGNSDYSATCSQLAQSVTPSTSNLPVDTLQIAYEMAQNPSYNVQNTFGYVASTGAPFVPSDAVVSDWSLSYKIAYSYNPSGTSNFYTLLNTPEGIAFDSYGNAWVASTGHGNTFVPTFVTELDPAGNYVATYTSYTNASGASTNFTYAGQSGGGTNFTLPIVIDPSNNAWTLDTGNGNLVRIAATSGAGVASTGTNYGISVGTLGSNPTTVMASDGNGNIFLSLGGSTYSSTFGANGNQGLGVLVPSITGGVLTAGTGTTVAKLANNTNKGIAITNSNSGSTTYGGLVYVSTTNTSCSSTDSAALNTLFSEGQTIDTTTTTPGEPTPIGLVVNSAGYKASGCTTATPATPTAASQMYGGSTYTTIPAMDTPVGMAADSSGDIWLASDPSSVLASGFPQYWVTELVPSYVVNGTTGALSASYSANLYTAPFLSGTSGGATLTTNPSIAGGAAIDGNGNVWFASSSNGVAFAVSQSGTFLNPTTPFITSVTNGTTTDNIVCGGFCGGDVYADYSVRRGVSGGFAGIAVDLAGNVWGGYSGTGANSVSVIVGVAAPPVLPTSLALKNGTLGTKP
jgi:hypothetical protein